MDSRLPSSLLNYLYGVSRAPLRTCLLWIALGQAPGLFLYAYLGRFAQDGLHAWRDEGTLAAADWTLWIAGFIGAVAVVTILSKIALRILAEAQAE